MTEVLYHYVYKIEFETGHVYFGVRSCKCPPEKDYYLGSPKTHKDYWNKYKHKKYIIGTYKNREEACEIETILISWFWSISKNLSLNASIHNKKFNRCGAKNSEEHIEKTVKGTAKPFCVVSPDGKVIKGLNLARFCEREGLPSSKLTRVVQAENLHYKGWTRGVKEHNLYLKHLPMRGISWSNPRKRWVIRKGKDQKYFTDLEKAKNYRDYLELQGNKFILCVKNWKEKLKT